jgi:ADP-ribosyl-[dinitrogen reductase] hydrolase
MSISLRSRFRGCLLGGAVGDALGAGIEFLSLAEIRARFGPSGVTGYVPAYGRTGAITDDTQMTLFTAEGLISAELHGGADPGGLDGIWRAYQRWLSTQRGHRGAAEEAAGWLLRHSFLHSARAPGTTCLSALEFGHPGSMREPVNDSKGCGGVMRVAPIGLAAADDPFILGCEAAALTHGHPSGYLAAGALALMVSQLAAGMSLAGAIGPALIRLRQQEGGGEVAAALDGAVAAAQHGAATAAAIAPLGQGWVAEEALAIAVYSALAGDGFRSSLLVAVNHGGDSDSTGAICGNLLGAARGEQAIDADLLDDLEGADVIRQVADDLYDVFAGPGLSQDAHHRYPAL